LGTLDEANLRQDRKSRSKQKQNFVVAATTTTKTIALKLLNALVYYPYQICLKSKSGPKT